MADPYLGFITMTGFSFAPQGYAYCNGAILPINQNQALYSLLGTMYGGDGRLTFALPDLRGRTPIHRSSSIPQGHQFGSEAATVSTNQIPNHTHTVQGDTVGASEKNPTGKMLAVTVNDNYGPATNLKPMSAEAVVAQGSNQAHYNLMPLQVVNFIIATSGAYPSRN